MRGVLRVAASLAAALASCLLLAAPALAAPQTFTVSGTGDPAAAACNGTVCPSLRDAVLAADANPGSTVQLGSATYTLSQGSIVPSVSMTITGDGPSATAIKQTASDRVIYADAVGATVDITGVTITGGRVTGAAAGGPGMTGGTAIGGGIYNYGTMALTDVVLSGNAASGAAGGGNGGGDGGDGGSALGGGIATGDGFDSSSLTLISTMVTGNVAQGGQGGFSSATRGGGGGGAAGSAIYGDNGSTIVVRGSSISGDESLGGRGGSAIGSAGTAGNGGGVWGAIATAGSSTPALTVSDSTIANNTATGGTGGTATSTGVGGGAGGTGYGGGVFGLGGIVLQSGTIVMTGSTVFGNLAGGGAGGTATAGGDGGAGGAGQGGGVFHFFGHETVVNSTISGNTAMGGAGGSGTASGAEGEAHGGGLAFGYLANVTLADNSAIGSPGSSGGNLHVPGSVADTIITGGFASGSGSNCDQTASIDGGHNLEETSPSQCGFSSAKFDLVGANPALTGLASNGGPTQTQALGPASAALGSGGSCADPIQAGNSPLTVDQRGLPRPAGTCDIGAYQLQPPVGTGSPQITGTPAIGQQLACGQGSWTDDQLSFAVQWLRDGAPISGATSASYTVSSIDGGHRLACRVTASNVKGTTSQTSAAVAVPSSGADAGGAGGGGSGAPVLATARETNRVWVEGNGLAHVSSVHKHPVGTVFSFLLSETASVRLTFMLAAPGRKVGKRCVAPDQRNRQRRACTRLVAAGSLTFIGHSALNKVAFQGRLSASKKLEPGGYTLLLSATGTAGQTSTPQTLRFTIVGR